ncbi:MAG: ECF-type sigma factor [Pirellulales bacterium]
MTAQTDVTKLLNRLEDGDKEAASELFPLVYEELKRIAKWKLADERVGHTLQPTALVNEAYVRLVGNRSDLRFESRRAFFISASEAMRHILVDAARRKLAAKRGSGAKQEAIEVDFIPIDRPEELVSVHEALDDLAAHDADSAELVKLHFFGGYSLAEAADLMNISRSTANRWWIYARAWLKDWIEKNSK